MKRSDLPKNYIREILKKIDLLKYNIDKANNDSVREAISIELDKLNMQLEEEIKISQGK
ncbi:MAG: hypothetical protein IPL53_09535 [Ignavibacteria bacterium]|nr:hypothetical protein [Ignavibacteria bacterium]